MTLKIRSRSPKPNPLFITCLSQCYIHANLAKIHPLVHEISCKQESVTPTPTGSAPKTICPPPLRWGDISRSRSPKPNQLFIMSQCYMYIDANLVRILPTSSRDIVQTRKCHADTKADTNGIRTKKKKCLPPLRWST